MEGLGFLTVSRIRVVQAYMAKLVVKAELPNHHSQLGVSVLNQQRRRGLSARIVC